MEIYVNQAGYYKVGEKRAIFPFSCGTFCLVNDSGETCFEGKTSFFGYDKASGDQVTVADFTEYQAPGRYRVKVVVESEERGREGRGIAYSPWFEIGDGVYDGLAHDLMKAYYYLRCGCDLEEKYAGPYTHKACHLGRAMLWEDHGSFVEATGGWHDAGDYGRYVTAGSCALAHLLYGLRMFPETMKRIKPVIPESGSGVPEVLSECRYELEWFLKLQREDGGVYHKVTTAQHAPFVMPEEDLDQLYALPVSSMATADFAAVCALAAPLYRPYDETFAGRLETAAKKSYGWLLANPEFLGFRNPKGCGTGEYGERDDFSNRFWAAAELYALTGEDSYQEDLRKALKQPFHLAALGYGDVGGFGLLAYLLSDRAKDPELETKFLDAFVREAAQRVRISEECGYGVSMLEWEYFWGSNMGVMKHGMIFAIADYFGLEERVKEAAETVDLPKKWRWPGEPEVPYEQGPRERRGWSMRDHAAAQLDYLMGCNALGVSYVTGNGERAYNYPHLRPAHADGIEASIPGMVSGGPNWHPADAVGKELIPEGTPAMKCFVDRYECYSLNEITIYWNSPAVFTLAYLMSKEA